MRHIITAGLCALLLGCMTTATQAPPISHAEIAQEMQRQKDIVQEASQDAKRRQQQTEERMLRIAVRLQHGASKLCRSVAIPAKYCTYKYKLETDKKRKEIINAYADGRTIIITPAMMAFTENDDELALILAHEFAHNLMGHITAQKANVLTGTVVGFALDMLATAGGVATGDMFTRGGAQLGGLSYSKGFETEADYVGAYIAALAGYNYKIAPELWRRMSIDNPKAIYNAVTHPTNPERYVRLRKTAEEISAKLAAKEPLVPNIDVQPVLARHKLVPGSARPPERRNH